MILVTHHVEEIVPLFSHVLVLKAGTRDCGGTARASAHIEDAVECVRGAGAA